MLAGRVAAVSHAYSPAGLPGRGARLRSRPKFGPDAALLRRAAALVRYDAAHPEHYPVPWWVAFGGTLAGALVESRLSAFLVGPVAFASFPLVWWFATRTLFTHWRNKRRQKLFRQFPDALSMIIRAVRAGIPVTESLGTVGREAPAPTSDEFQRLHGEISIGLPVQDALWEAARRTGLPEYRFFAVALSLQGQTGGNLTETLQNLGDVIRRRVAIGRKAMALTSEARTTAAALVAMPFLAAGGLALLQPAYLAVLFTDDRGRLILAGAIGSLTLGILSMRFIIKRTLA